MSDARRPMTEALLASAALSLLFILVYGASNAFASERSNLAGYFFSWELRIPFVPFLIVPYLSIDLFFVASFLLCADKVELRTHARRIAFAILIAGLTFLVFPLAAGYPRPNVSGWTGWLFEFLWSFDKPHNLVPSLHVALASLLWPVYARRTKGYLRWLVHGWFALIIASPLLTWQHHVLDVATGAMLGQLCMYAFPDARRLHDTGAPDPRRNLAVNNSATAYPATDWQVNSLARSSANLRVAMFYGVGSAALGILAIGLGSWFWFLLWPAVSLALIAIAYLRGSSAVFRKFDGRLPISTRVVLGPYLLGMLARLLFYRRRVEPWIEVAPGVYCGRLLNEREASGMLALGVTGILDLTAEHSESRVLLKNDYLNVPVLDLTKPSRAQLDRATSFIAEHACRGGVYVHCALGVSRSIAAIAPYRLSTQADQRRAMLHAYAVGK